MALRRRRADLASELRELEEQIRGVAQQMRRLSNIVGIDEPGFTAGAEPERIDGREVCWADRYRARVTRGLQTKGHVEVCLLYTSPSPRDRS